jgi:hypothetical protein
LSTGFARQRHLMLLHLFVWRCCLMAVLLGLILCLCLPPLVAADKRCPLGTRNGNCSDEALCAVFEANATTCIGWSNYRCIRGEYRNMQTCECIKCPRGTGVLSCAPDNECCALDDCKTDSATTKPTPSTATPKPTTSALAPASRLSPREADGFALLLIWLLWLVSYR